VGGDEFLVVLRRPPRWRRSRWSKPGRHSLPVRGDVVSLRASVGVALARCDADTDPMTLVRQADVAMYEAKRAARADRERLAARN
jgi:GGDEF domain-containing protein